ncbi:MULTISPECIES: purine-nucleoside phosphorylase [unclassified Oceanispirochaeta]|uniref:purine-nucleoside phosphorylase n=1 Tax=unclassified Oceanispirochaeta TaxID=2635722 RepID=UPI000E095BA6|nr:MULTISPECIES: purine-nucleoside phosphorylase [unclassified Oceanispirochaeta]MBF9018292.1 purine-nucleoside phosphorylase [Oceanispirochaeta sp. M2]NPD74757.1 purine-nucleoside phosphorylase [Oceanispirochaeta sp. M1]RDG29371.1 purine-nucleoside phosphorylase [Oceanispirochaeta sp. M1]
MFIPTPHIEAVDKKLIAKTILMPGDPLRAKYIAETFLENIVQFNAVRGINGYTGEYKGRKISVMASGMGMPSIGIYSYELYKFYDVENIIRIGSCGTYTKDLKLFDVVLVEDAWSESTYAKVQSGNTVDILRASVELNSKLEKISVELEIPLIRIRIHSSDVFYRNNLDEYKAIRDKYNCSAVEMESFALFSNAQELGKKAACLLSVSDSLIEEVGISSADRQMAFTSMIKIALEMAEN